jgi:hypothetical protein
MRSLLVLPAATFVLTLAQAPLARVAAAAPLSSAFAVASAQPSLASAQPSLASAQPLITSTQAAKAMTAQIHRQTAARLRGGYHGETLCSGEGGAEQPFSPATELARWHCKLELRGARFPRPCTAVANVLATSDAGRVRIEWLRMGRYCRSR